MERRQSSTHKIKGKLISALCMLLVAATMVVSSTYAWFTLSTAPEVSGITTAIGANGALEIWLNTTNTADGNYIPGNIVQLDAATYGLQKITLLPSALNVAANGTISPNFLKYPEYGPDGRPGSLNTTGATTGTYDLDGNFYSNDATGVRGVGVASGLTDRQVAYRSAKQTANTNKSLATSTIVTSLNTNGAVLGNIVIKKATTENATYTPAEVTAIGTVIDDLKEAVGYLEIAYKEMIVALAASNQVKPTYPADATDEQKAALDTQYNAVYSTIRTQLSEGTLTLAQIATDREITVGEGESAITVPLTDSSLLAAIIDYNEIYNDIYSTADGDKGAATLYDAIDKTATEYAWDDISGVLNKLINVSHVTLNEKAVTGGVSMNDLANSVLNEGINIQLNAGSGAYFDIADHCGNYSASVTMTNVQAGGYSFESLTANMVTTSTQNPFYLDGALTQITNAGAPEGDGGTQKPMTEFYGFIIDLSFKTNAANSNLLLQTDAKDRIYSDNNNADTQGAGSYMTYKATTTELTTDQIKNLMDCIRIVFFDPTGATHEIIGYAMLDTATATTSADGVTAQMYMAEKIISHYTYNGVSYYVTATTTEGENPTTTYAYYSNAEKTTVATLPEAVATGAATQIPDDFVPVYEYVKKTTTDENNEEVADPTIAALTQNEALNLSVLVYLDGDTITNGDVAATAAKSVTGTMNLQFASDANLVPMEYGALHTPGTSGSGE